MAYEMRISDWSSDVCSSDLLSNIALSSPATIAASDVAAFDNLTVVAGGAVTGTGLLQSGLATNVSGSDLPLGAITAGTEIDLPPTAGAIGATAAMTARHDARPDAAPHNQTADRKAGEQW